MRKSKKQDMTPNSLLEILNGEVVHIGEKFTIIEGGGISGIVFINEMDKNFVQSPLDVVNEGERVEFAVLGPDPKKPGKYLLSLAIVPEIKLRQKIEKYKVGQKVKARVTEISHKGVGVTIRGVPGFIPRPELSHSFVRTTTDIVSHGDTLDVEIIAKYLPDGWKEDKRKRGRAHLIASVRQCTPRPTRKIKTRLGALRFQVEVRVKLPRRFDPVVQFVLKEIDEGSTKEQIALATGLSTSALDQIMSVLSELNLINRSNNLTASGHEVRSALQQSKEFNERPIQGLFVSAAPGRPEFLPVEKASEEAWPRGFPPPPYNRDLDEKFICAQEEAVTALPFRGITKDENLEGLQKMLDNRFLNIYIRRIFPNTAVLINVDEAWILGALWKIFETAESNPPYYPRYEEEYARELLVIECELTIDGAQPQSTQPLWWEPQTDTFWKLRENSRRPRLIALDHQVFPNVPKQIKDKLFLEEKYLDGIITPKTWNLLRVYK